MLVKSFRRKLGCGNFVAKSIISRFAESGDYEGLSKWQLDHVRRLNHDRDWGFIEKDFPGLPNLSRLRGSEIPILVFVLADQRDCTSLQRTFNESWDLSSAKLNRKWRWDGLTSDQLSLRYFDDTANHNSMYWVALDQDGMSETELSKFQFENNCEEEIFFAGPECMILATLDPMWFRGRGIVRLRGYRFGPSGQNWQNTPSLFLREEQGRMVLELSVYVANLDSKSPTVRLIS